jgi:hypothetical protein
LCLVLSWIASIVAIKDLRPYSFACIMLELQFLLWPMIVMCHSHRKWLAVILVMCATILLVN